MSGVPDNDSATVTVTVNCAMLYASCVRTRRLPSGIAAILSAFALAATLTACISPSPAPSALPATSASPDAHHYPASIRSNFLAACEAQNGATSSLCGRCLEVVEGAYTYDDFVKLDTAIRMKTASRADSDRLASILKNCA